MTADQRLAILTIKVDRAKEHLAEVERESRAFLATRPYEIGVRRHAETQRTIYYVSGVRDTPPRLAAVVGDVIQNLRSALDQLAAQLVEIGTGTSAGKHVYFPIGDDLASYSAKKAKQTTGMTAAAVHTIDALRPYKGGNESLWQVHALNIIDKHRALLTVGSAFHSVDVGGIVTRVMGDAVREAGLFKGKELPTFDLFLRPADRLFPLRVGAELFEDLPDAPPDPAIRFQLDVALGEPGILEGEPLVEALSRMVGAVESTLPQFAAHLAE